MFLKNDKSLPKMRFSFSVARQAMQYKQKWDSDWDPHLYIVCLYRLIYGYDIESRSF